MISTPIFGPINSINDVQKCFSDLQTFLNQFQQLFGILNTPPASDAVVIALDSAGALRAWTIEAGSGVTVTVDDANSRWIISAP